MKISELVRLLAPHALALWPDWLAQQTQSSSRADGGRLPARSPYMIGDVGPEMFVPRSAGEVRLTPAKERSVAAQPGGISVIPVKGMILPKRHWAEDYGLATSLQTLSQNIAAAIEDPETKAIVLDVDSPGGIATGLHEFAADLRLVRGKKPIVAHADFLAASAAYWIASQADEIVASPSALVGSVGVYSMHIDQSKWLEQMGIDVEFIHAGEDKVLGNSFEPLTEDGRAYIQGLVDDTYRMFIADIAEGRGVDAATVKSDYGKGRILTATDAKKAGVIDKIRTFTETLSALGVSQEPRAAAFNRKREARVVDALESPEVLQTGRSKSC